MLKRFYEIIKLSLSGTELDFTKGKITKAIFILAVPMILEMTMESVFAVADIIFVAKLGHHAVTAVGITESIMTLVYAVGIGLSAATTAVIARRIGQKKPEEASRAAGQSVILAFLVSLPIMFAGLFFPDTILEIMGAEQKVIEDGRYYTQIVLSTNIVIILLFVVNAAFRSSGDAATAFKVLALANGLNIVLDPLLIFGFGPVPALGLKGAAVATTLGRGIAVAYQLYLLFYKNKRFLLKAKHLLPDFVVLKRLIKLSQGGILQYLISTTSWIFLVRIISSFGSVTVAGYTIGIRIILFLMLPAWGFANSAATLTGQNLGAGKPGRAEKSLKITARYTFAYTLLSGLLMFVFADTMVALFIDNPEVISSGADVLRFLAFGLAVHGIGLVYMHAFNGAGDTQTPMWINFGAFWVFEIPLAYYMAYYSGMAQQGVYLTIVLSDLLLTISAYVLFRRGRWKNKEV